MVCSTPAPWQEHASPEQLPEMIAHLIAIDWRGLILHSEGAECGGRAALTAAPQHDVLNHDCKFTKPASSRCSGCGLRGDDVGDTLLHVCARLQQSVHAAVFHGKALHPPKELPPGRALQGTSRAALAGYQAALPFGLIQQAASVARHGSVCHEHAEEELLLLAGPSPQTRGL